MPKNNGSEEGRLVPNVPFCQEGFSSLAESHSDQRLTDSEPFGIFERRLKKDFRVKVTHIFVLKETSLPREEDSKASLKNTDVPRGTLGFS